MKPCHLASMAERLRPLALTFLVAHRSPQTIVDDVPSLFPVSLTPAGVDGVF